MNNYHRFDCLIVGAGGAGLMAALEASLAAVKSDSSGDGDGKSKSGGGKSRAKPETAKA